MPMKIHEVLRNEVTLTQAPKLSSTTTCNGEAMTRRRTGVSLTARIVMNVIKADGIMTQYRVWLSAAKRSNGTHGPTAPVVKIRWHALRQTAPHVETGQSGTVDQHKHFRVYREVEALAWKIVDLTAAKLT